MASRVVIAGLTALFYLSATVQASKVTTTNTSLPSTLTRISPVRHSPLRTTHHRGLPMMAVLEQRPPTQLLFQNEGSREVQSPHLKLHGHRDHDEPGGDY